ncbi:sulfite exporter TauE/SafE family protein [Marivita sp. S6314]|uniref:sulfite exporter TauE/SafE family protein n=1 Tax=Marivita sp. S6314 TaxID=2926406 RepID=UPI001FF26CAC|nr:sulfite exporter TauE/SafE family protein [Marivita sp. S6314]MCK0148592.1 sulfite exporter TauE/SafE family protein [Marivita sp. S6314]
MPEFLLAALDTAGLDWLLLATLVAGIVYGFAGFGAALVFLPVATVFLPPAVAIAAFSVSAMSSLVTVFPKALPMVDRKAVTILIVSATVSASLGIWVLTVTDVTVIRWVVVAVCAITLCALIAGWRYELEPSVLSRASVGAAAGFIGGVSGLTGPIMVLFQLAGRDPIAVTRATTVVFLTTTSLLILPLMYLQGILTVQAVALGILFLVPYAVGALIGQALFRPERDRFYRVAAYVIIAVATVMGLPIWDTV